MRLFILTIVVLGAFINTSGSGIKNCGCLPGRKGAIGPTGNQGKKGEVGEKGEVGDRGDQGDIGKNGPKGNPGAAGVHGTPGTGIPGPTGAAGYCLCGRYASDPVIANDYYLTDEKGEPNYIGNKFNEEDIHGIFENEETTQPLDKLKVESEQPNNGLFMMNQKDVLIPVTDANEFELFATETAEQTTTTTEATTTAATITKHPNYSLNNIYILGPKGSLIPIQALAFNQSLMADENNGNKHDAQYKYKPTSSYVEWLRSILMGEESQAEFNDDDYETIHVVEDDDEVEAQV